MAPPKYTDYESLSRRLRGRLNVPGFPESTDFGATNTAVNALLGYGQSATDQSIDLLLIDQLAGTQESYIDLILSQLYKYPLQLTSEVTVQVLKDISECLIISSLIAVAFEGQSSIIPAADISQSASDLRRQGEFRLAQLTAGTNIFIPNSLQSPNMQMNVPQMQMLRLPGEVLLGQSERPDDISRNYTFQSKRNTRVGSQYFNEGRGDCGTCSPRNSDGTAMGSDPNTYCIYDNTYYNYEKFD
jgi:hypothetical protein